MACFWQGKVKLFDGIYLNKKKNQKKSKSQSCWVTWYIPNVSTTCCHPNLFHSSMLRGSFQTSDRSLTDLFKFIWNAHIHTLILQFFLKDTNCMSVTLPEFNMYNSMMNFLPVASLLSSLAQLHWALGQSAVWGSDLILGVPAIKVANFWLMLPTRAVYKQQLLVLVKEEFWVFCVLFRAQIVQLFLCIVTFLFLLIPKEVKKVI